MRLIVIPIARASSQLHTAISSLCRAFITVLPPGTFLSFLISPVHCILYTTQQILALENCLLEKSTQLAYLLACSHLQFILQAEHTTMYKPTCMSAGTEVYTNAAERWHITVFHTSQFDDTRPRPLEILTPDVQGQDSAQRPLPTSANLQQEQETVQMVISKSQPLLLQVMTHTNTHNSALALETGQEHAGCLTIVE